jgi:hypothetical protein
LVSRSHFAVGHFRGPVVFPAIGHLGNVQVAQDILTSSFALLQSLSRSQLAVAPSGMGLSAPRSGFASLQHVQIAGVHQRGFASPASFRLQGLDALLTACSPRDRVSRVSGRQRSWDFALRRTFLQAVSAPFFSPERMNLRAVAGGILPAAMPRVGLPPTRLPGRDPT